MSNQNPLTNCHASEPLSLGRYLVRSARASDLDAVKELLSASGLSTSGVEDAFPNAYLVATSGDEVVGVAGLEIYAESGLLRSVAVNSKKRDQGIGKRLVEQQLRNARKQEIGSVYLLTTTAASYFRSLGFLDIPRHEAPLALQRSSEFVSICPNSAVCLVKRT